MALVELTKGKFATVDDGDWGEVMNRKWRARLCADRKSWVAVWGGNKPERPSTMMHRFIMDPPEGHYVVHKNGDGLDNRRCNLLVLDQVGYVAFHREKMKQKYADPAYKQNIIQHRRRQGQSRAGIPFLSKLTWQKVGEIRTKHKQGASCGDLAKEYEVSVRHIGDIISGKRWKESQP